MITKLQKIMKIGLLPALIAVSACSYYIKQWPIAIEDTAIPEHTVASTNAPSPQLTNGITGTETPTNLTQVIEQIEEVQVKELPLPDYLQDSRIEFSGLAWYGEELVLLPQYPHRVADAQGRGLLYAINKQDILRSLSEPNSEVLTVQEVWFDDAGLHTELKGFEGFESIVFDGEVVYLTVETRNGSPMMGYLVQGNVQDNLDGIRLNGDNMVEVTPQASFQNATDESILAFDGNIYTIFEDNGLLKNPEPQVHAFNSQLESLPPLTFPNIEYRITDATDVEQNGTFWVMNYFYPGDTHLEAENDPIAVRFGEGETHQKSDRVERILQMQITPDGVLLSDIATIQLQLLENGESRNWEGLVKLDDIGFITVTDKFPTTILGFVSILR